MKFVLGGGINGLIYNFYNKDHKLLCRRIGDYNVKEYPLDQGHLQINKYTEKLLKDLELYPGVKTTYVGYCDGDKIHSVPSDKFKDVYDIRVRGSNDTMPSTIDDSQIKFKHFNITVNEVMNKLISKTPPLNTDISFIDYNNNIIYSRNRGSVKFSELVSTLPLPTFLKLMKCDVEQLSDINTYNKVFILTDNYGDYPEDFDTIYYINSPYTRVTRYLDRHVMEFVNMDINDVGKFCRTSNLNMVDIIEINDAQICDAVNPYDHFKDTENIIKLVGATARWDNSIQIEDVIRVSCYGEL